MRTHLLPSILEKEEKQLISSKGALASPLTSSDPFAAQQKSCTLQKQSLHNLVEQQRLT